MKKKKTGKRVKKKDAGKKTRTSLKCFDGSDCKPREKPPGFCDGCGG